MQTKTVYIFPPEERHIFFHQDASLYSVHGLLRAQGILISMDSDSGEAEGNNKVWIPKKSPTASMA
ncbi:MAG: hypothetical protein J6S21_06950, partial [Victivallales bacterium]|nr:hypothetical protein [Victivallales bacterium]